ncbi:RING-H2 finger protein ATL51-like [Vigna radiata var. radiata]|uniref:RING-type E3 ubiquitin transferase n=1 Tax=Vigna radiata var. radiata TaxID=3916 RepID=A0A3Q0EQ10_VIGRR|nr:RING-H2 finger protein ATL51-like [Vigna radiata var. radiata]
MSTVHHYYNVMRVNDEHTRVLPGDYFNFEVKVRFHSEDTFPAGLQHHFSPASIPAQNFFQEERAASEEFTQRSRRSQRVSLRRSERLSSRASGRQSSRLNQRQSSEVNHGCDDEILINRFLKKCTVIRECEDCCICLEEMNVNAECYTLSCQHVFHLPCILTWLKTSHVCPLCRHYLPTGEN